MLNPFDPIVSVQDYIDIIGLPKEQQNNNETLERLNKWLIQATEQFDSMISGNGEAGKLYKWVKELEDNQEDKYKKYKLIKAICSWVETFVIKGKFWVDGLPTINSNINIELSASSDDSNVESKRKDIIQDLVSINLYRTTNFGMDSYASQDNQKALEEYYVLTKAELNRQYLKVNPQRPLEGNLDYANNDIVNGGNIIGNTSGAKNKILNYDIQNSTIDFDKNEIIGSAPLDPEIAKRLAYTNRLNDFEGVNKFRNDVHFMNTNNQLKVKFINNSGQMITTKQPDQFVNDAEFVSKGYVDAENNKNVKINGVQTITGIKTFANSVLSSRNTFNNDDEFITKSYVDNQISPITQEQEQQNSNIEANANAIDTLRTDLGDLGNDVQGTIGETNVNKQEIANLKNLTNEIIEELRNANLLRYRGEWVNGTTYNIGDVVSKDNIFYFSNTNNNTTTPPSSSWPILEGGIGEGVDLSNYYNKQEIDASQNTQDEALATLTNTVNNNWDNTVKTTNVNQEIQGQKAFTSTGEVLKFKPNSNTATFIAGYQSDNRRLWFIGKGSNLTDALILGTDRGHIEFQANTEVRFSNKKITNLANPTEAQDAATKSYVDTQISNIPAPDLTNVAKKNENNNFTFTQTIKNGNNLNLTLQSFSYGSNKYAAISIGLNGNGTSNNAMFDLEVDQSGNTVIRNRTNTNGKTISFANLKNPTAGHHAANKDYVDSLLSGIPAPDLGNYYTKSEVDASQAAQDTRITTNTNNISTINTSLNNVAKLNQANTFAQQNTYNSRSDFKNIVSFRDTNNNEKLYFSPTDGAIRTLKTNFTLLNELVSKQYVDTQISNIPGADLTNVAKLNQNNTFTANNTFNTIPQSNSTTAGQNLTTYQIPNKGQVVELLTDTENILRDEFASKTLPNNFTGANTFTGTNTFNNQVTFDRNPIANTSSSWANLNDNNVPAKRQINQLISDYAKLSAINTYSEVNNFNNSVNLSGSTNNINGTTLNINANRTFFLGSSRVYHTSSIIFGSCADNEILNKTQTIAGIKEIIKHRTIEVTINNSSDTVIGATSGYTIVMLNVARKRNDGTWLYIQTNTDLKFEVNQASNNNWRVYNAGSVNNVLNVFRCQIIEIKN